MLQPMLALVHVVLLYDNIQFNGGRGYWCQASYVTPKLSGSFSPQM